MVRLAADFLLKCDHLKIPFAPNRKVKLWSAWSEVEAEPEMVSSKKQQQSGFDLLIYFEIKLSTNVGR